MGAVARPGALDCRVETKRATRPSQRLNVSAPRFAVEIDGKQPATVIGKQRIDPDDLAPLKVREQLSVAQRDKRLIGSSAAADLWLATNARLPLVLAAWRIARSAARPVLPAHREDVFSAAEEITEQPDFRRW